jgi:metal-sulfur cluster biosynthetic enzyme
MKHADDVRGRALELAALFSCEPNPEVLRDLLRDVIDPEIGINIVDLGLVYDIGLSADGAVAIRMTLTTRGSQLGGYLTDAITGALRDVPSVTGIDVQVVWDPPWDPDAMMSGWAKNQLGWRQ